MRTSVVVGTRPEIIKMAPVYFALEKARLGPRLVHSGQHYDYEMSKVFFEELELPEPVAFLGVGSGLPGQQTGDAIIKFEREFSEREPDCVLVEGDTNTVLAATIAAMKKHIKVGHVEAGLRSYDLRMPEELNRRLTDHASDYLFAPTEESVKTLRKEGVWGKVFKTGNTVIDATVKYLPKAMKRDKVMWDVPWKNFALATFHRAENVDDPKTLEGIVRVLCECPLPVVLPLHPRTDLRLRERGLKSVLEMSKNVELLRPAGYLDMLLLMKNSSFVMTDSGGIQEEVCSPAMKKKVFVIRKSTERPEAVRAGYAKVLGTNSKSILRELRRFAENPRTSFKPCPYGKGDSGQRIASILKKNL
ncbi:MAG: UDP-N-acetylglucosamine 2-epimerase (non-hydrolyzing) [Candidatus Thermoplasmatota archaeon]|nr:UDP-N-acetylglucosamine 2-epimerase (non-hydrolyzing) [Candidatus Thermoplasmatota archaeon]